MTLNTIELRNYLIQPGQRDQFIDYFEEHFIFSQQAAGMAVLGQFRVIGAPDHFVWLRGFTDMAARRAGLHAFYDGPIWRAHRDRANAMIADSDHVHLLCPLGEAGLEPIMAEHNDGAADSPTGLIVIDIYRIDRAALETVPLDLAETYRQAGIQVRAVCAAEMAENDYPRLPVIQNAGEFIIISAYPDAAHYDPERVPALAPAVGSDSHETLRLIPTLRSPLRW